MDPNTLHAQHAELGDLWKAYRRFAERRPRDDQYWHDVAETFSVRGVVKSDFGAELAQTLIRILSHGEG